MSAAESLKFFVPEIILLLGALGALLADVFTKNKKAIGFMSLGVLAAAIFLAKSPGAESHALFSGFFVLDSFTHIFRLTALGIVGATVLISISYPSFSENSEGEYYSLFLFMAFALVALAGASNLLMIFLALEFISILSYLLVGFLKKDPKSKEAAIKYLLYGSVASGVMLYGMSLLFGLSGSLELSQIATTLTLSGANPTTLVALIFVVIGFGFKISMAPFHMWAPDVYQAAPTPVTAFLTVGPKALGFALLLRVLSTLFTDLSIQWVNMFSILAILTMTIGNVLALSQTNIKRLLAYSSVAQAGYILMGIVAFNEVGLSAVVVYLIAYAFTNLGAFTVVLIASANTGSDDIDSYAGIAKRAPFLAASMTLFLLSLAGIPPLAGFIGKFLVFASVIEAGNFSLAIAAAINSAIAAFYYFRIVKAMYLAPSTDTTPLMQPLTLRLALIALLAGVVIFGLAPMGLLEATKSLVANVLL